MGLDCYVEQSHLAPDELEIHIKEQLKHQSQWNSSTVMTEIWYGRKTAAIMDYLTSHHYGEANCEFIPMQHNLEDLINKFKQEVLLPNDFDEYELGCFKDLIDSLEQLGNKEHYLYFYAWY